jgi:hypothetical protein
MENVKSEFVPSQGYITGQILSIIKAYRAYGLQYVPVKLRNGWELVANDGRKAVFSCSNATKAGHHSSTKFLAWLHWEDSGKVVKSKEFNLFSGKVV